MVEDFEARISSFEEADSTRNKLIRIWSNDPKHEGMQVKIKWMPSKNKFVVKKHVDKILNH